MIAIFLQLLEEKKNMISESEVIPDSNPRHGILFFREGIQSEYTGTGYIKIEKNTKQAGLCKRKLEIYRRGV